MNNTFNPNNTENVNTTKVLLSLNGNETEVLKRLERKLGTNTHQKTIKAMIAYFKNKYRIF